MIVRTHASENADSRNDNAEEDEMPRRPAGTLDQKAMRKAAPTPFWKYVTARGLVA